MIYDDIYNKINKIEKKDSYKVTYSTISLCELVKLILNTYNEHVEFDFLFNIKECKFVYEDYNNNILENWITITYEEILSFSEETIIPYDAYYIGIYNEDLSEKYYEVSLARSKTKFGKRLYRVGLMSDIHYNDTSIDISPYTIENIDGSEYDTDLDNALTYYQNNQEISFMCASGDISTDSKEHLRNFALNLKIKAPSTPFYSCLGNHDFQATHYETNDIHSPKGFGLTDEYLYRIDIWNNHITPNDNSIHYFNENTIEGKLSYYIERNVPGTNKSDIYIFLSLDYGVTHNTRTTKSTWDIQAAQKMLDYNDLNVKKLMNYVGCKERTELQKQYDYQFYNSEVLVWLAKIIDTHPNKRIFLFTHPFFIQKSGNNNGEKYYNYGAEYWRISQKDEEEGQVAYCLCGLQFEFLNLLNNRYRNIIWFSGHSHYSWKWQLNDKTINICNNDYDIYDPKDEDFIKEKRYLRKNNTPICGSAYNIHLPSLARPIKYPRESTYGVAKKNSEGAIMDIYEDYVDIRGIIFKDEDIDSENYINKYYPLAQYRINIKAN